MKEDGDKNKQIEWLEINLPIVEIEKREKNEDDHSYYQHL